MYVIVTISIDLPKKFIAAQGVDAVDTIEALMLVGARST